MEFDENQVMLIQEKRSLWNALVQDKSYLASKLLSDIQQEDESSRKLEFEQYCKQIYVDLDKHFEVKKNLVSILAINESERKELESTELYSLFCSLGIILNETYTKSEEKLHYIQSILKTINQEVLTISTQFKVTTSKTVILKGDMQSVFINIFYLFSSENSKKYGSAQDLLNKIVDKDTAHEKREEILKEFASYFKVGYETLKEHYEYESVLEQKLDISLDNEDYFQYSELYYKFLVLQQINKEITANEAGSNYLLDILSELKRKTDTAKSKRERKYKNCIMPYITEDKCIDVRKVARFTKLKMDTITSLCKEFGSDVQMKRSTPDSNVVEIFLREKTLNFLYGIEILFLCTTVEVVYFSIPAVSAYLATFGSVTTFGTTLGVSSLIVGAMPIIAAFALAFTLYLAREKMVDGISCVAQKVSTVLEKVELSLIGKCFYSKSQ